MRARTFFFVCAGILCLALAFHLGARSARGQAAQGEMMAADLESRGSVLVSSTGDTYYGLYPSSGDGAAWSVQGNIGASFPIVAIANVDGDIIHALAADGSFYVSLDLGRTWALKANAFGGVVPTQRQSLGRLKARWGNRAAR